MFFFQIKGANGEVGRVLLHPRALLRPGCGLPVGT